MLICSAGTDLLLSLTQKGRAIAAAGLANVPGFPYSLSPAAWFSSEAQSGSPNNRNSTHATTDASQRITSDGLDSIPDILSSFEVITGYLSTLESSLKDDIQTSITAHVEKKFENLATAWNMQAAAAKEINKQHQRALEDAEQQYAANLLAKNTELDNVDARHREEIRTNEWKIDNLAATNKDQKEALAGRDKQIEDLQSSNKRLRDASEALASGINEAKRAADDLRKSEAVVNERNLEVQRLKSVMEESLAQQVSIQFFDIAFTLLTLTEDHYLRA